MALLTIDQVIEEIENGPASAPMLTVGERMAEKAKKVPIMEETPNLFIEETKMNELHKRVIELAAKSKARKRKVGALIFDTTQNKIVAEGFNHMQDNSSCENEDGKTKDDVIHAEVAAIDNLCSSIAEKKQGPVDIKKYYKESNLVMLVSYAPCQNCAAHLEAIGIKETIVVDNFMKFDASKLRYELIPPSATKALATVLTYGAKKYKPNNWKNCEDTSRYIGAMMRHIEAWRAGEEIDPDSKLPHLAHAMTNLAFLIELDVKPINED